MKIILADGSGSRNYKHLYRGRTRHGQTRIMFRRGAEPQVRLHETPGTEAFDAEYKRIFARDVVAPAKNRSGFAPDTLDWLVQRYYRSADFHRLKESTRYVRRGILDRICQIAGFREYATMPPKAIAALRDANPDRPDSGNGKVKALRQLFAWACLPETGYMAHNPARDVRLLKSRNPAGFREWTEADVEAYEARHPLGTKARLALDLLLYTGVRRSDVVRLGPGMEDNGFLVFAETKGAEHTVKSHRMPILAPLRASLDATATGHMVYLVTPAGAAHSAKAFGGWFKRRCAEAGINPELAAHGLRKLGATRLADNGATTHELMAVYGWTKTAQAEIYTRQANRKLLEARAMGKLLRIEPASGGGR